MINNKLADERNVSEKNRVMIKDLHKKCEAYVAIMDTHQITEEFYLKSLGAWRKAQAELQELWGWEINPEMWQEWRLPKCTCPQMDNDDVGFHFYKSEGCPLHG